MIDVTILFSAYERGGITRAHFELFQEFSKVVQVNLVCFENRTNLNEDQNEIEILSSGVVRNSLYKLPIAIKRYRALKKYLKRRNSNILICADPSSTLLGWLHSKQNSNLRIIGSCHVPRGLLTFQDKLIVRYLFPRLKDIVVPSVTVANDLRHFCSGIKVRVIPNMLPTLSCQNSWPSDGRSKTKYLYFGRFSSEKNPIHFLKMASKDIMTGYILCGEGSELTNLSKILEIEKINNVEMAIYQSAHRIMPRVALVVIPSKYESFGISAIESWIQGVPVLTSTEAKGIVDLMHSMKIEGANLSLESGIDEWIHMAHEVSSKGLDSEISRKVLEEFHPSSVITKWIDLISLDATYIDN